MILLTLAMFLIHQELHAETVKILITGYVAASSQNYQSQDRAVSIIKEPYNILYNYE